MKRLFVVAVIFALISPALAQQQPDPAFLQKAVAALQAQRNAALDGAAVIEAKAAMLAEENAKLKARVEELEKKSEPPK